MAILIVPLLAGGTAAAVGASLTTSILIGGGTAVALAATGADDWIDDNILKPIADAAGDVLKSNLGQAVLKVAALSVGAPPWVVPLISGAGALAEGGDFGDALKAAAISYVAASASEVVGEIAGDAVANATSNATVAAFLGAGGGAAARAIVYGQDPVQAFLTGGISTALPAINGFIDEQTNGLYAALPEVAQNVLSTTLSKALSGQDIGPEAIMNAVLSAEAVTNTVSGFLGDNTGYSEAQIAAITSAVQRTTSAAFGGGDIEATLANELNTYADKEFKDWFNTTAAGVQVTQTMDKLTGDYQRVQAKSDEMNAKSAEYMALEAKYVEIVAGLGEDGETLNALAATHQQAIADFDAGLISSAELNNSLAAYNDFLGTFDTKYPELKAEMDKITKDLPELEEDFSFLSAEYDTLVGDLTTAIELADDDLKPLYEELDKTFVKFMDPNFDEVAYAGIAGLGEDEDAYYHWLTEGKAQNLPTNMEMYNDEYAALTTTIANNVMDYLAPGTANVFSSQAKRELIALISAQGTDITALRALGTDSVSLAEEFARTGAGGQALDISTYYSLVAELKDNPEIPIDDNIRAFLTKYGVDLTGVMNGEYVIAEDLDTVGNSFLGKLEEQKTGEPSKAEGVTDEDIANGNATLKIREDGLLEWDNLQLNLPYWSEEFGRLVKRDYYTSGPLAGSFRILDALTGKNIGGNRVRIEITQGVISNSKDYAALKATDPGLWAQIGAGLDEAGQAILATDIGQDAVDFINKWDEAGKFDDARDYGGLIAKAGVNYSALCLCS